MRTLKHYTNVEAREAIKNGTFHRFLKEKKEFWIAHA